MIDLYYWTTPNGHKITIFLEEAGLEYRLIPVNISKGEQFAPAFLAISPNNRMPAIVDHAPADGGEPISVFESGAILEYLADKTGQFLPRETRPRNDVLQWLHWQMGGLGPMLGQVHHFKHYAPEPVEYAIERYHKEGERLYGVLERQLEGRVFVAGDELSIADMAIWPWLKAEKQEIDLARFPAVAAYRTRMAERDGVRRAMARIDDINPAANVAMDEEARRHLFGQGR
ncbi:glutathione S-transferase N-terminal domain-containing protein [Cobetia marina]|uniref:glutathione S-transferase N-terminal domain-containing protein n=1 Tax=Cobetia marina TaxID=28258 RepID=UPI002547329A|nr:glutathione S-transferase N-terminal domain-containing protein [Cobetia pacifica]MDI6003003.1 glutathione S-transferase N-terminal domain-containing protein [Cobetia pacifica]